LAYKFLNIFLETQAADWWRA